MPSTAVAAAIDRLLAGQDLGREGAAEALELIMAGEAGEAQTAGFLIALRAKGESAAELAGLASVVRKRAERVEGPDGPFIDTCGTGGGASTFNVSTATTFVVAGAGVRVAKHGNRSATSKCGSADVLEALGASIDLTPAAIAECLTSTNVGFMFAPAHHPAFKHIVPVRRGLGVRTVFNLLGPLTNPAGAPRQLLGVSDGDALERMGQALCELGCERAFLVSGRDGLDEVSIAAPTDVVEVVDGRVRSFTLHPAELGFDPPADPVTLRGGEPRTNADTLRRAIGGVPGAARDLVVVNAAAALWLAGRASDMAEGRAVAEEVIDTGAAADRLEHFIDESDRLAAQARERGVPR